MTNILYSLAILRLKEERPYKTGRSDPPPFPDRAKRSQVDNTNETATAHSPTEHESRSTMNEPQVQATARSEKTSLRGRFDILKVMIFLALLEISRATAQSNLNNTGTNDPISVLKNGFCGTDGINQLLVNGTLLFISLLIGVIIYGWNQRFGNRNAGEGLRNAVIGTLLVAGSTTIAKAFVSNGCT